MDRPAGGRDDETAENALILWADAGSEQTGPPWLLHIVCDLVLRRARSLAVGPGSL
jgi:hypothetical protein